MNLIDLILQRKESKRATLDIVVPDRSLQFLGFVETDYFEQNTRPDTSDPTEVLSRAMQGGYRMNIKKGTKRMTLFRFLVSKMVLDPEEGLSIEEFLVLSELYIQLRDSPDPDFQKKWESSFIRTQPFFEKVFGNRTFPLRLAMTINSKAYYSDYLKDLILDPNSYFGIKGNRDISHSYSIRLNDTLIPQAKFRKAFIGVGYRDKGTCRKVSLDGSPDWKTVGSYYSSLESVLSDLNEDERQRLKEFLLQRRES